MPETSQSAKVTLCRMPATTMNDLVISYQWNFDLVLGIDILHDVASLGTAINSSEHYNCCCIHGTQKQYFQHHKWVTESVNAPLWISWWGDQLEWASRPLLKHDWETGHLVLFVLLSTKLETILSNSLNKCEIKGIQAEITRIVASLLLCSILIFSWAELHHFAAPVMYCIES